MLKNVIGRRFAAVVTGPGQPCTLALTSRHGGSIRIYELASDCISKVTTKAPPEASVPFAQEIDR